MSPDPVIAPALAAPKPRASRGRGAWRADLSPLSRGRLSVAAFALGLLATAARAQFAGAVSFTTDERYRGVSISADGPAADLSVSYDAALATGMGVYGGASADFGRLPTQGPRLVGHSEYAGLSFPGGPESSWDIGVSDTSYSYYYYQLYTEYAPEIYAGRRTKVFRYYLHYSPRYFHDGAGALYADIAAAGRAVGGWRVFAHVGVLTPTGRPGLYSLREQYDFRAGIATGLGPVQLSLAWTSRRPSSAAATDGDADALVFTAMRLF